MSFRAWQKALGEHLPVQKRDLTLIRNGSPVWAPKEFNSIWNTELRGALQTQYRPNWLGTLQSNVCIRICLDMPYHTAALHVHSSRAASISHWQKRFFATKCRCFDNYHSYFFTRVRLSAFSDIAFVIFNRRIKSYLTVV